MTTLIFRTLLCLLLEKFIPIYAVLMFYFNNIDHIYFTGPEEII